MSNDWLSKRRDAEALEHQSFDACYTADCPHETGSQCYQAQFKSGFDAALEALRSSPVEFDEKAISKEAMSACVLPDRYGEPEPDQHGYEMFIKGARWQFEKDRERIALADRDREIALEADDKRWAAERRIAELTEALEWIADTTRREFGHGLSAADVCYQLRKRARKALGRNDESAGEK